MLTAETIKEKLKGEEQQNGIPKAEFHPFYNIDLKESQDGVKRTIRVDYYRLVKLLRHLGFTRMDVDKKKFIVRIIDNVVQECSQTDVIDIFDNYLKQFGENLPDGVMRDNLIAKMYGSLGTYFCDHILNRLQSDVPIVLNEHTRTAAFYYYRNGFVKITKDKVQLLPYSQLDKMIWRDQIIDRDFVPVPPSKFQKFSFFQFANNIANNRKDNKTEKRNDPERFLVFQTIVGYCLHSYFEGKLRAIIFTDSKVGEDANGRTGKTLLFKALQQMLNANKFSRTAVEVNGKDFDLADRFKWQDLGIDTRLVCLNDIRRKFNFEGLFNDITEGIKCQKKNETPYLVPAKMVVNTNLTIRIHGDSAKDRCMEFELSDYYNANFSPENEFSQWFFRDWSKEEWNYFDNFMCHCVKKYLTLGLLKPESINLEERKKREETSPEFCEWFEDLKIENLKRYDKKELFEKFIRAYSAQFKKLTPRTFNKWLKLYAEYSNDFDEYEETRANGQNYITFTKSETALQREDVFDPDFVPEAPF